MSLTIQTNNTTPQVQQPVGQEQQIQPQGAPSVDQLADLMQAPLVVETITNARTMETGKAQSDGKKVDPAEVPELDVTDVKDLMSIIDDLEKIIAMLKNDSTEEQIAVAKERIAALREQLNREHGDRLGKIDESLNKMDEAADAAKAQKKMGIFSCVMAVVAALVAVVAVAAAVFTGGASLAIGFAVFASLGALCSCASAGLTIYQQCNQDEMQQKVKDKAQEYRDQGMSASEAWKQASEDVNRPFLIANICLAVGGLVCGLASGGLGAAGELSSILSLVQSGLSGASMIAGIVNLEISDDASDKNFDAQTTQAELSRLEAMLEKLKKALDENNDEIQKLVQQLMESLSQLAELLQSAVSTTDEIVQQTGATA